MQRITLPHNWEFKQHDPDTFLPTELDSGEGWLPATVPGTAHQDLLALGHIPDPFIGMNENEVQWVGEQGWLYRCTFNVSAEMLEAPSVDLVFEGLDTYANIWLNGRRLTHTHNMFVPLRIAVRPPLQVGANILQLYFESVVERGHADEANFGAHPVWNGDASRVYVRKAQYHYGWDWGPKLLTTGIWKPVILEAYRARIDDLHAPATVSDDLTHAELPITFSVDGATAGLRAHLSLHDPAGALVSEMIVNVADGGATNATFQIADPVLWYPRGYGDQARYRLTVTLLDGDTALDWRELKLGLRRLRLVQEPLRSAPGTSFYFEINNIPIFCGGANWIPADNFLPRITDDLYRRWLELAAEGNVAMLRVWGGGIYESDAFYEICDELGLLVWQDFMFACGIYPATRVFLTNVREEAEAAVRRLRHHPSLVLWAGNNEDYSIAVSHGAYDASFEGDFTKTPFPAREIYERLLPDVCGRLDPTRPYWPGSPYGGADASDPTVGDRHTWEIWHGAMADYQNYTDYSGRFISEFGMQGLPDMATIESFSEPADRVMGSALLNFHNKAEGGERRIAHYLAANLKPPADFAEYLYQTQFIQSEAIAAAFDGWRARWNAPGDRLTGGALVWQLNDCWPVISWALADSFLRPKPAYYRMRRALAPIGISMSMSDGKFSGWVANRRLETLTAEIALHVWSLDGESLGELRHPISAPPNASTPYPMTALTIPNRPDLVIGAQLIGEDGAIIARAAYWPGRAKDQTYRDPGLQITRVAQNQIKLEVERPARGVVLSAPDGSRWRDAMFDLLPGDSQIVESIGAIEGSEIRVSCLAFVDRAFSIGS